MQIKKIRHVACITGNFLVDRENFTDIGVIGRIILNWFPEDWNHFAQEDSIAALF
jgi:hypothetical protein